MRTRKLGATDLELTVVGFGTWALGGGGWAFGWGPQDDRVSTEAIHAALEGGINWIDTAPVYGLGHAEEVVGTALKNRRPRPIIATKCGLVWDDRRKIRGCLRATSVRAEAEASLRRLRVDVIDLYQIHWPNPDGEIEEGWAAIADLIREGKIRYAGVSNFSVDQVRRAQRIMPIASLQPPYSLLQRDIEREVLGFCAEYNIGVVAYSPIQKGLLSGTFTRERAMSLPQDDHRRKDPMFLDPQLSANLALVERLREVAERRGVTVAQLAIAWVLRRPEVTAAIVGGRSPAQVAATLRSADLLLAREDVETIDALLAGR
ncbi:MAG: aldo/keto reductase [Acidobacteriota bacterium]